VNHVTTQADPMPGAFTNTTAAMPTRPTRRHALVEEEKKPMFAESVTEDPVTAAVRPEVEAYIRALVADHLGVDVATSRRRSRSSRISPRTRST